MILRLLARGRTGRRTAIPARTVETPRRSSVNLFKGHTTRGCRYQNLGNKIPIGETSGRLGGKRTSVSTPRGLGARSGAATPSSRDFAQKFPSSGYRVKADVEFLDTTGNAKGRLKVCRYGDIDSILGDDCCCRKHRTARSGRLKRVPEFNVVVEA